MNAKPWLIKGEGEVSWAEWILWISATTTSPLEGK